MAAAVASRADAAPNPRSNQQEFQKLVLTCNKDGMDFLRKGQHKQAFEQLKYAEAVLGENQGEDEPTNLLAVTCNNLGCYYKKVGKLHAALSYLRKSLKIEVNLQTDDVTVAGTHLNICAILSKLDKHDKAAQHALCALDLITNRINTAGDAATQDDYSVLAIAYHNVAVERDYMQQWDQAAAAYQQGHEVARRCLGDQHPLTQTLAKNCQTAQQKSNKHPSAKAPAPPSQPPGPPASARARGASHPATQQDKTGSQTARGPRDSSTKLPDITSARGPTKVSKELPPIQSARGAATQASAMEIAEPPSIQKPAYAQDPLGSTGEWAQPAPPQAALAPPRELPPLQPPLQQLQQQQQQQLQQQMQQQQLQQQMLQQQAQMQPQAQRSGRPLYSRQNSEDDPRSSGGTTRRSLAATPAQDVLPSNATLARTGSPPPLQVMGPDGRFRDGHERRSKRAEYPPTMNAQDEPPPLIQVGGRRVGRNAAGLTAVSSALEWGKAENGGLSKTARESRRKVEDGAGKDAESRLLRRTAAVKIQNAWREYVRARNEATGLQKKRTWAATKIQACWRGFHVVHTKRSKAATEIQRIVRGYMVRLKDKRRKASTQLQRHFRGVLARKRQKALHQAAMAMQRRARGMMERAKAQERKRKVLEATIVIHKFCNILKAKTIASRKRAEKDRLVARENAALRIQKTYRGHKTRVVVRELRRKANALRIQVKAALMVQSFIRRKAAQKIVQRMRKHKIREMNEAATRIRAHWLKYMYRKRYTELRQEFKTHEPSVVVMQRYMRGYLVRMRMWKDAIRAEEELWAAVEIQRCWRGYCGRLKWEMEYESVWSREAAVRKLQTHVRGWLARTRVHRLRKRQARADFERARRRFKAAQRIQSLVRGRMGRRRVAAIRDRKNHAANTIQRIFRGRRKRVEMWHQVVGRRAVQIQSLARGFLVRKRRAEMAAKVIAVQQAWRRFSRLPEEVKARKRAKVPRGKQKPLPTFEFPPDIQEALDQTQLAPEEQAAAAAAVAAVASREAAGARAGPEEELSGAAPDAPGAPPE